MIYDDPRIGFLSGPDFARGIAVRFGAVLGLSVVSVVIAILLVQVGRGTGISFLVGLANWVPWLLALLAMTFLWSIIPLCWRRMRSLGLPAVYGLLVPVLFLVNGLSIRDHAEGVKYALYSSSLFWITAIVFLVAMSRASPPSHGEPPGLARFGLPGALAGVLAACVTVLALAALGMEWSYKLLLSVQVSDAVLSRFAEPLRGVGAAIRFLSPWLCIGLWAMLGWLTLLSLKSPRATVPDLPVRPIVFGSPRQTFGKR